MEAVFEELRRVHGWAELEKDEVQALLRRKVYGAERAYTDHSLSWEGKRILVGYRQEGNDLALG